MEERATQGRGGREVIFFGEFDPTSERVVLDSYFSGFKQEAKTQPFSGSVNQLYRAFYDNRVALRCS